MSVFDVPAMEFINEIATDLKENKKVEEPSFVVYVKTGSHRERAPLNRDWWYVRTASILRRLYVDGPTGTESLRSYYGGKKNRGSRPNQFRKASGKIIRTCLQSLEKEGLVKHQEKQGRIVTSAGQKYLHAMAKVTQEKLPELLKQAAARKIKVQILRVQIDKERAKMRDMNKDMRFTAKKKKAEADKEDEKKKGKGKKK